MRKSTSLALDPVRLAQLRDIAEAKHYDNITDLLAAWIRQEVEAGVIPDSLPGVTIREDAESVNVTIDSQAFTLGILREALGRMIEVTRAIADGKQSTGEIDTGNGVATVKRQGVGIKLIAPDGSTASTAPSIARDMADLLEKHAAPAPQP